MKNKITEVEAISATVQLRNGSLVFSSEALQELVKQLKSIPVTDEKGRIGKVKSAKFIDGKLIIRAEINLLERRGII